MNSSTDQDSVVGGTNISFFIKDLLYLYKPFKTNTMANNETIGQALGLSKEWEILNRAYTEEESQDCDTISETLITSGNRIKKEAFYTPEDINIENLTDYEKKLLLAGFSVGASISRQSQIHRLASLFGRLHGEDNE